MDYHTSENKQTIAAPARIIQSITAIYRTAVLSVCVQTVAIVTNVARGLTAAIMYKASQQSCSHKPRLNSPD